MRHLSIFLFIIISTTVFAGDYYEPNIDTYDPATGLYYKAVEESPEEGNFLSSKASHNIVLNIAIFDPAKGTYNLLFKEPQKSGISIVLFETGFKEGSIEFNGSTYSRLVLNNTQVAKRNLRDKLLVGVRNKELKSIILFVSDKKGGNLTKLAVIPYTADWHIDVKNSKLRVVHQTGKSIRIESFEW